MLAFCALGKGRGADVLIPRAHFKGRWPRIMVTYTATFFLPPGITSVRSESSLTCKFCFMHKVPRLVIQWSGPMQVFFFFTWFCESGSAGWVHPSSSKRATENCMLAPGLRKLATMTLRGAGTRSARAQRRTLPLQNEALLAGICVCRRVPRASLTLFPSKIGLHCYLSTLGGAGEGEEEVGSERAKKVPTHPSHAEHEIRLAQPPAPSAGHFLPAFPGCGSAPPLLVVFRPATPPVSASFCAWSTPLATGSFSPERPGRAPPPPLPSHLQQWGQRSARPWAAWCWKTGRCYAVASSGPPGPPLLEKWVSPIASRGIGGRGGGGDSSRITPRGGPRLHLPRPLENIWTRLISDS